MNPTRAFPLILLFGSMAFSQTFNKEFSSETSRANCPVELKASLNVPGKIVPVQKGRSTGDEQRLKITLGNPQSELVAAQITVHGFPVGVRLDPAVAYFPSDSAEIRKTIVFDHAVAAGQKVSFDVSVHDFSTVSSIDLDSVTYSDGSRWHPANRKSCKAVPLPSDIALNTHSR